MGRGARRKLRTEAVDEAVDRWRGSTEHLPTDGDPDTRLRPDVLGPWELMEAQLVAQRGKLEFEDEETYPEGAPRPSQVFAVKLKAGIFEVLLRTLRWIVWAASLGLLLLSDVVTLRTSTASRARRLRVSLQGMGGTFVKLGQQLSLRADILPFEYTLELARLLDRAPPIRTSVARSIIEDSLGPIDSVFAEFDDQPIGSASIACVYRGRLHDGRDVAIKVRRPDAARRIGADLRIIGWLAWLAEGVDVLRKGNGSNLHDQLETILTEELDFRQEARYVELFRDSIRKTRRKYLDAPRVHHDLSGADVLVMEFVVGIPCGDLLRAVDTGDEAALARFKAMDIDPCVISQRLLVGWNWQVFNFTIFHGDPHPANIVLQPGNKIVLVDFGACGFFSQRGRRILRRIQYHLLDDDFRAMAQAALGLMEPVPPMDMDSFAQELEGLYASYMQANKSDHAQWWERATSKIWMDFIGLARKYQVPISIDTLRLFRATFLMDTVAFRLDPGLKLSRAYKRFIKEERKWERRRFVKKGLVGPTGEQPLGFQQLRRMSSRIERFGFRLDALMDASAIRFMELPAKAFFLVSSILRFATTLFLVTVGLTFVGDWFNPVRHDHDVAEVEEGTLHDVGGYIGRRLHDVSTPEIDSFSEVISNPVYQVIVGIMIVFFVWRLRRRLDEVDPDKG